MKMMRTLEALRDNSGGIIEIRVKEFPFQTETSICLD